MPRLAWPRMAYSSVPGTHFSGSGDTHCLQASSVRLWGFALQTRRRWLRILAPILGLALHIAAHILNNPRRLFATLTRIAAGKPPPESEQIPDIGFFQAFATSSLIQLTIFVPFWLIMAFAVWRSGVWERRVIREELASEIGRSVTPDEYRAIA